MLVKVSFSGQIFSSGLWNTWERFGTFNFKNALQYKWGGWRESVRSTRVSNAAVHLACESRRFFARLAMVQYRWEHVVYTMRTHILDYWLFRLDLIQVCLKNSLTKQWNKTTPSTTRRVWRIPHRSWLHLIAFQAPLTALSKATILFT